MKSKILIIEDNEQNIYLVTYILEKYDFQVIQARNGAEGILKGQKEKPDMILLDIQLPVMNGYEVARELRKCADLAKIPIIAITSYAMPGDRENALAAGCSGYIEKPINPDTFINQVRGYFNSKANGDSLI